MGNSKAKKLWKKQCHEERKKNYSNGLWCDPYDWVWYGYISKDKLEKIIGVEPKPSQQQQPRSSEVELAQPSPVDEEGRGVKLEPPAMTTDIAEKSAQGSADATQQQQPPLKQEEERQEDERCPVGKIIDFDP